VKKLQNFLLDDHAIKLSLSTKAVTAVEQEKKKEKVLKKRTHEEAQQDVDDEDILSQKLMVKNLAFECTQEEVREMFKPYGTLKKVRLPKKVNS
jgi:multiple RNA-binding domain-containing protein 1